MSQLVNRLSFSVSSNRMGAPKFYDNGSSTPCALQDVSEVALSPTSLPMWPLLERSVHVTSDFHCEWAIVATQTMASTDETFLPWGSPYRSIVIEQVGPRVVSVLAVAIEEVRRFVSSLSSL